MKKYIGCDLGGTNLRAAIIDIEDGTVIHSLNTPTLAHNGHDEVIERMGDLFLSLFNLQDLARNKLAELE